jgi:dihydroorotate dehydrogenase (NAD+) catalytic subunit
MILLEPNLKVKVGGLQLKNPTMLSAGVLGLSGSSLRAVWEAGAGAVVSKSLGLNGRKGHPNPTVVNVGCGFINSMGLPNPGAEEYAKEIKTLKRGGEIVLVASIYGARPAELAELAKIVTEAGGDAVELNLSCPNVEGVGMEVGQDPHLVQRIVKAVKNAVDVPVFTKLTPNISDIKVVAEAAAEAGADGLVAINTVRALALDVETGRPILSSQLGGLSGPAIKPIALRCVYEASQVVSIPVIGCGGVTQWQDAVEFFLAGASAVQIGTAIAYKGLSIFKEITYGTEQYLKKKSIKEIGEIIGKSHKY